MGGVYLIILNSRKAKKKKIIYPIQKLLMRIPEKRKNKIKFLLSLKHIEIIYYIRKASD